MKVTPSLMRIHAHICGDGAVYQTKEKRSPLDLQKHKRKQIFRDEHIIEYWNTCDDLLKEFISDFAKTFQRKLSVKGRKYQYVRVRGAKHIISYLCLDGKNSYTWYIPDELLYSENKLVKHWIRAFFDDEATVGASNIIVKCMNKNGLLQIQFLLKKFSIHAGITGQNCDNSWYLRIYKKDISLYLHEIGFSHPKKVAKLVQLNKKMGREGLSDTFF